MTCILRSKNDFLNCYSFLSLQNGSVCQRKNGKGGHLQMASKTRIQSAGGFSQNSLMILVLRSCKENMQDLSFGKKTRYLIWYELAQASSKGCHKKVAEGKHFFSMPIPSLLRILYVSSTTLTSLTRCLQNSFSAFVVHQRAEHIAPAKQVSSQRLKISGVSGEMTTNQFN